MALKKKPMKPKPKASPSSPPRGHSNGTSTSTSSVAPKSTLLPTIFAAIIAFMGGVLTPPSLHAYREGMVGMSNSLDSSISQNLIPQVPCSKIDDYLHAIPVHGLHVICVEPISVGVDGKEIPDIHESQRNLAQSNALRFTLYKGSHAGPLKRRVVVKSQGQGIKSISWHEVKMNLIIELLLVPEGKTQQPWAVFTALGDRIVGANDNPSTGNGPGSNSHVMDTIATSGVIVVSQGGNWVWPGVREGFERTIQLAPSKSAPTKKPRNITIETLSLKPLVVSVKGFLSEEECDYIAEKAGPSMRYSAVSLKDADKGRPSSDWRTSQSTFLSASDDPILKDIEYRTASLTRVPHSHQEYVQVLRYGTDEKYDAHHDYFDPRAYKSDQNTLRLIENGKKNRFATVFWYLTDVNDGGHTIFPRAGGLPPVRNHADCSRGLKVQPQKGKVVIFYSLDAAGGLDEYSLHGACPVGENNVKWAANKWIWNAPMNYVKP
ncbi:hypothetical protein ACHAWF_015999 [Thalassiosira exigua]